MSRPLAYLSLIAILFFVGAVIALHFLAPDVDPLRSGISYYALTRYGILLGLAVALAGVAGIALSIALRPALPSMAGRICTHGSRKEKA